MLEDKAQPQYSSTIERDRFSWRDQSLFQVPSYDASISEAFLFLTLRAAAFSALRLAFAKDTIRSQLT